MTMNTRFSHRTAVGTILGYRIVAAGASSPLAAQATGPTQRLLGTASIDGAADGKQVDVCVDDFATVTLGGTVAAGDRLTSDASACAVATTTPGHYVIGTAWDDGVAGDEVLYRVAPDRI